jgi:hypothetical protein
MIQDPDIGRVTTDHARAKRRLDALLREAGVLGERLGRLAHGLSTHPERLIIGSADPSVGNPSEWDIVPNVPLPSIERLVMLTNEIREANENVELLRERLILLGRADLVEEPEGFFS